MTNRNARDRNVTPVEELDRPDLAPTRRQALASVGPVVYAVRFPDGVIKFGYTRNLNHRLDSLANYVGKAPELVGFRPGTFADEHALHESLRAHLVESRREFYHPAASVMAEIAAMRDELGLPPLC